VPICTNPQTPPALSQSGIQIHISRTDSENAMSGMASCMQSRPAWGPPSHIRGSQLDPEGHRHRRIWIREVVDDPKRQDGDRKSGPWPQHPTRGCRRFHFPRQVLSAPATIRTLHCRRLNWAMSRRAAAAMYWRLSEEPMAAFMRQSHEVS